MFTIDYNFYKDVYGGSSISDAEFTRLSDRAIGLTNGYVIIDLYDDYDIPEVLDILLHKAVCAVADLIKSSTAGASSAIKPIVSQESVAGVWSKSYATTGGSNGYSDFYFGVISVLKDYLGGTKLLFKGGFIFG